MGINVRIGVTVVAIVQFRFLGKDCPCGRRIEDGTPTAPTTAAVAASTPTITSGTTGTENQTAARTTARCSVTTRRGCSCAAQQGWRLKITIPTGTATGTATDVPRPTPPPNLVVGNFFPRISMLLLLLLLLKKKIVVVGGGRQGCLLCGFREGDAWIVFHLSPTRESMRWICHGADEDTVAHHQKQVGEGHREAFLLIRVSSRPFGIRSMARLRRVLYRREWVPPKKGGDCLFVDSNDSNH